MTSTIADLETVKARMKATWMDGDFGEVAKTIEDHAVDFIARRNITPGMRVLDVACGTGNLAIPAAKAGAVVTGVDIATNLVEQARERARLAGLSIQFDEGDAEDLPYPDASFDLVVSMYGAMFAPRPERAASELLRVCRPGGTIALASWTPGGFVGQVFKMIAGYIPPTPGVQSPVLWGDEEIVRERLGDGVSDLEMAKVKVDIRYPFDPRGAVDFQRTYFGPTIRAFAALPEDERPAFDDQMVNMFSQNNRATDGTTDVESEYLEVVAKRV
ncbi:MAG: class I SAM-dependent methyltransferase [bacterium]|nr:class I SAM-dependent methyltransferase [Candidatus Kapabacteria bacterium]